MTTNSTPTISRSMKPISKLEQYGGNGNPIIRAIFTSQRGWQPTQMNKRVSTAWLLKLRKNNVTMVSLEFANGNMKRTADFTISELLSKR